MALVYRVHHVVMAFIPVDGIQSVPDLNRRGLGLVSPLMWYSIRYNRLTPWWAWIRDCVLFMWSTWGSSWFLIVLMVDVDCGRYERCCASW